MIETEGPADLVNKKNDTPDIEFDMSRVNLWMALFRLGANAGTVDDSKLVGMYIKRLENTHERLLWLTSALVGLVGALVIIRCWES